MQEIINTYSVELATLLAIFGGVFIFWMIAESDQKETPTWRQ